MMRWLTLPLFLLFAASWPAQEEDSIFAELDKLFAGRDELRNLQRAELLLTARTKEHPSEYESLWRAGRIWYYLAEVQKDKNIRLNCFEKGLNVSRRAVEVRPERPEGHFWLAANLGEASETRGIWSSLRSISTIRSEFERVFEISPAFDSGKGCLALGEMKLRLPGLLGGDDRKGIELLEKGLLLAPDNHEIKLALASVYPRMSRNSEARILLRQILESPDPALTPKELAEIRAQAQKRLTELK